MRFLLFFLLLCNVSFAQNWNTTPIQGGKTTLSYFGSLKADLGLLIPKVNSLTWYHFKDSVGAIVSYQDSLYYRSILGWQNISRSGVGNTIYTGDGTLSSDRVIDCDGNSLQLINGNFAIGNLFFSPYTSAKKIVRTPTPILSNQYMPMSVNSHYADLTGNIIDTGYKPYVDSVVAASTPILTLQDVTDNGYTTTDSIIAASFKRTGGTSSQFLKANGSVDNSTYLTTAVTAVTATAPLLYTNSTTTPNITADTGRGLNKLATGGSLTKVKDSLGVVIANKGTVSSIATSNATGITGGTITTSGTLSIDTTLISTRAWRKKGDDSLSAIIATKGSGTVLSIATGNGLSGGTITTSGTLTADTTILATKLLLQKKVDSLNTIINTKGSGTVTSITLGRGITGTSPVTTTATIGLDTTKNYTWSGVNTYSPSVSASSAIGRGFIVTPNITATANNDTLVGAELSPTYNANGFTGTQSIVRVKNGSMVIGANTYQLNSLSQIPKLYVSSHVYLNGAVEIGNDATYGFRMTANATETNMQDRAARGNSLMYIGSTSSSVYFGNYNSNPLNLIVGNAGKISILNSGNVSIGGSFTPTATLHIRGGTASANSAPIKLTSGTNLTTPENGAIEYDGTNYYATANGTRQYISKGISGSYSGTGTATTAFTVTFGGTQPNATYQVLVTPTNSLTAAVLYVTTKTTTSFTVTFLTGLTGSVQFDWHLINQ
jgi:hypothetical protein